MARIGFLSLSATGHISPSIAPAKAMQERGRETIFFSVVGREHTITERSMGFVSYGFGEYPARSLTEILERIGRLKGVMPSHKVNGRTEHRMAKVKFFEAEKIF